MTTTTMPRHQVTDVDVAAPSSSDGGWSAAVTALARAGVTDVYGLPDDDMRAMTALEAAGLRLHRTVRQASAMHMAAGHAAVAGGVGACVIGRGPAVAAAVPGLLEIREAGRPLVVLAAGTATRLRGTGAFQDAPTLEMVTPVTKRALRVEDPAEAGRVVAAAVELAQTAPAGPVYVELPDPDPGPAAAERPAFRRTDLTGLQAALQEAERPLLLLGSGARSCAQTSLVGLAADLGAGVVVTASGRGSFPEDHPAFLGLSGLYLIPEVAEAVREADTVLAVGSRLEETALEGMPTGASTRWLQVNLAPEHLVPRLAGLGVVADVAEVAALRPASGASAAWAEQLCRARAKAFEALHREVDSRAAQVLLHLTEALPAGSVTVHENGLHDIWSYSFPHLQLPQGGTSLALSEQTTLGGSVAAAAGAARAGAPLTVCLTGDTAMSTLLPDLQAVLGESLPLLYVVFDDGGMGWLDRQAQEAGVAQRFVTTPALPRWTAGHAVVVADDVRLLGPATVVAVERALTGRPTVMWVPVDDGDIAPQLRTQEAL